MTASKQTVTLHNGGGCPRSASPAAAQQREKSPESAGLGRANKRGVAHVYRSETLAVARLTSWLLIVLLAAPVQADAPDSPPWSQWRGPNRDGTYTGPTWPARLKGQLKQLWRVELGPSYASPVIAEDRVFTVETKNQRREIVRAYDRTTGKQLWQTGWDGAMNVPFFAARNGSWVRSSPAYDGESLYVAGMRDLLVCLDAQTGEERWRVDFVARLKTPLPSFGCVCSPLVTADAVYIQAGAGVVKLDKTDGKILWRSLTDSGGMYGSAFSSPVIRTLAGREQLVVLSRAELAGLDLATGKVLWRQRVKAFRGMNILTPTIVGDSVFTSTYGGFTELHDISPAGAVQQVKTRWKFRLEGYMSSPIVIGDHAYLHLRKRRFACVSLKTGQVAWQTERRFGQYWSMINQGDRILALDQNGRLLLIDANPERFTLLDERPVSDAPTWAHLAMSGRHLAIRELNALAVYEWTPAAAAKTKPPAPKKYW